MKLSTWTPLLKNKDGKQPVPILYIIDIVCSLSELTQSALNKYKKIKKVVKRNLLDKNTTEIDEPKNETTYGSYFDPQVYLQVVDYNDAMPNGQILPHIKNYIHFPIASHEYYPVVWVNQFWQIKDNVSILV
jgi:hypothetical protein